VYIFDDFTLCYFCAFLGDLIPRDRGAADIVLLREHFPSLILSEMQGMDGVLFELHGCYIPSLRRGR